MRRGEAHSEKRRRGTGERGTHTGGRESGDNTTRSEVRSEGLAAPTLLLATSDDASARMSVTTQECDGSLPGLCAHAGSRVSLQRGHAAFNSGSDDAPFSFLCSLPLIHRARPQCVGRCGHPPFCSAQSAETAVSAPRPSCRVSLSAHSPGSLFHRSSFLSPRVVCVCCWCSPLFPTVPLRSLARSLRVAPSPTLQVLRMRIRTAYIHALPSHTHTHSTATDAHSAHCTLRSATPSPRRQLQLHQATTQRSQPQRRLRDRFSSGLGWMMQSPHARSVCAALRLDTLALSPSPRLAPCDTPCCWCGWRPSRCSAHALCCPHQSN